ncbi:hypothetical protein QMZ92_16270 [Streptomyces sp. HNM0645]|uniref:hypothetical protein n=1 Tax=Streptomyces sp. HNM0645 TaxID=2782343 RepID=UPI0024B6EDAD|nr:hypothetical protein [Streptomyces sp. HNM0645]MDI9885890.1 hypothetical protein [Streptomyces sp. HNM0645]
MTTYNGQATLITESGAEISVVASLRNQQTAIDGWSGTLTMPSAARTPELLNLLKGRLLLSTGREAGFDRPNTSDWMGSPAGSFRINIVGNDGDVPF